MCQQYEGKIENKLNIIRDCSCNFLLSYAYPLSMAETSLSFLSWNNQNYIYHFFSYNKFRNMNSGIYDALEYGSNQRLPDQIFQYDEIDYQSLVPSDRIVDYLITMLNEHRYIIIFLDNKELLSASNHFMHEYLIYGYNRKAQTFSSLYYINHKYTFNTIPFNNLMYAYKSLIENIDCLDDIWRNKCIMTFKLNDAGINTLNYSPMIFREKMRKYIRGDAIDNIHLEDDVSIRTSTFGIKTTYGLSRYLVDLRNVDNRINYGQLYDIVKTIKLFLQHREGILKKTMFYQDYTKNDLSLKLYRYKNVLSELKKIQLLMLKDYYNALNQPSLDAGKNLVKISEQLQQVYVHECEIWDNITI